MAAPMAYLGVWQIVFRLWPPDPQCQGPDGSVLLCIVSPQYTELRDLTAVVLSLGLAIALAAGVYGWTLSSRQRPSARGRIWTTDSR